MKNFSGEGGMHESKLMCNRYKNKKKRIDLLAIPLLVSDNNRNPAKQALIGEKDQAINLESYPWCERQGIS